MNGQFFMVNVGKYTISMDPMGHGGPQQVLSISCKDLMSDPHLKVCRYCMPPKHVKCVTVAPCCTSWIEWIELIE